MPYVGLGHNHGTTINYLIVCITALFFVNYSGAVASLAVALGCLDLIVLARLGVHDIALFLGLFAVLALNIFVSSIKTTQIRRLVKRHRRSIELSFHVFLIILIISLIFWLFGKQYYYHLNETVVGDIRGERGRFIFYTPEPGLSSFGIFSIYALGEFIKKNNWITITIIAVALGVTATFSSLLLLTLMTTTLRLGFLIYFLIIIPAIFGIGVICEWDFQLLAHAKIRMLQLWNMSDHPGGSPALRVEHMTNYVKYLFGSYANTETLIASPVGFVKYLTAYPFSVSLYILLLLRNTTLRVKAIFIVSFILLPVISPFGLLLKTLTRARVG